MFVGVLVCSFYAISYRKYPYATYKICPLPLHFCFLTSEILRTSSACTYFIPVSGPKKTSVK